MKSYKKILNFIIIFIIILSIGLFIINYKKNSCLLVSLLIPSIGCKSNESDNSRNSDKSGTKQLESNSDSNDLIKAKSTLINDYGNAIVLQPDGKILVAGNSGQGYPYISVLRYNTDGTLDTSFGTNGIIITIISSDKGNSAKAITLQRDGKILVAGYYDYYNCKIFVLRYNTDGTLDKTFGTNGLVITDISNSCVNAYAIVLQRDGKILVAGNSRYLGYDDSDILVIRYNTDGTLDKSFGTDGIILTNVNQRDYANAIALQSDGKILVAGYSRYSVNNNSNSDAVILRYNTDGTLDTSFGTDGIVITDINDTDVEATSIAIQPDGKILVAGHTDYGRNAIVVIRYNTDGTLDTSFGTDGIILTNINERDHANAIALQRDGKILVAGYSVYDLLGFGIVIVRYNTDGTLDKLFRPGGVVMTKITNDDQANAIALQRDGKIIVAGYSGYSGLDNYAIAILRYNSNGTLDKSFGTDGIVKTETSKNDHANAIILQP